MSPPQKLSAVETLRVIEAMVEDHAAEREMDRILALEPQELERELVELGIDPAAARAQGDAIARWIELGADPTTLPKVLRPNK
jgi:hypothetical protein